MKTHSGIDAAQKWFDICILVDGKPHRRRFANSREGLRECILWLSSFGIDKLDLVMEPTGRYSDLIAEFFYRRKHRVCLVQPLKLRRFAESLDMRGKSDFKDSYALAVYSKERSQDLQEWCPRTDLECELRDMHVLIRSLTKRTVVLQCQLSCGLKSQYVLERLRAELESCENELKLAVERAHQLIKQHAILSHDFSLLLTIPGVGEKTAVLLLTLIDFRKFKSSRKLACFLGLTKRMHQSGTSIQGPEPISKRGSAWIRGALFMPARAARRSNVPLSEFANVLLNKNKHDWVIQTAVIRKLITMAWSIVVNGREYDSSFRNEAMKPI